MHIQDRPDLFILAVRIVRVTDETDRTLIFRHLRVWNNMMKMPVRLQILKTLGLIHDQRGFFLRE
jgi:hypothetical protein